MSLNIKKIAITLAIPLVLYVLALAIIPLLLDSEKAKQQLATLAKEHYGLTITTAGKANTQAFPAPAIYFADVTISNESGKQLAAIQSMKIGIGWLRLFSNRPASIELLNPAIILNHEDISRLRQAHQQTPQTSKLPYSYKLINATIELAGNPKGAEYHKESLTLPGLSATITTPVANQAAKLSLQFTWNQQPITAELAYNPQNDELLGSARITNLATIKLEGKLTNNGTGLWQGDISGNINDTLALTHWLAGATQLESADNATKPKAYPLSFSAPASISDNHIILHRSNATFQEADAEFAAFFGWQNHITLALELNPETLQADKFLQAFSTYLLPTSESGRNLVSPLVVEPLPDYFTMNLLMDAEKVSIGQKLYNNLNAAVELDNGDVIVHHTRMQMPGESNVTLDGILQQLPEGRRFSGQATLSGKHFNQWLANFEPLAAKLPKDDFSAFNFAGNLFISKEQLRLSEADLRIGELGFQGGFAAFFDQLPRVEADIRLKDINLDYFRDIWHDQQNNDVSLAKLTNDSQSFEWLRRLPAVLDFYITMNDFTFLGSKGKIATTRLYSRPGELLLSAIDIRMKKNVIGGNVKFDVKSEKPKLDVVLTASKFNTDYFETERSKKARPLFDLENTKQRWSEELFDFSLLDSINGSLDISIGTLIQNGERYQNFKWRALLNNKILTIKKLSFSLLDGTFNMSGNLIGGSVPGISATFSLYNADLKEIIARLFGRKSISGRISLSGVIGASGIHPKAWLKQGDFKLTAAARGVRVRDFNLQSVIDTTKLARSTQDVKKGVEQLLFDGVTELSVDGNINVKQGIAKTPGIKLTYGRALGSLMGEMNLLDWRLNLNSAWQFPELSSTTIPTMNISLQGDIDDYDTRVDTSSLEAFVAKRIVGQ